MVRTTMSTPPEFTASSRSPEVIGTHLTFVSSPIRWPTTALAMSTSKPLSSPVTGSR